jgi:hypothetical protein
MYSESLPMQCPPSEAVDDALPDVYRLVANETPSAQDFRSKAALGIPLDDGADSCMWSSCSLFTKTDRLLKFKRLKAENPFLVKLEVPAGSGKYLVGSSGHHVDYWLYKGNCLASCVVSIEDTRNG